MLRNLINHGIILSSTENTNNPFTAEDFISKLFPDGFLWGAVTQILAFLVLVFIVYKLLYKPVKKMLNKRAESVEENMNVAEKTRFEMEEKLAASDAEVLAERQKAQALVAEAVAQSEKARADIMAQAKAEVASEKEKAYAEIEQARIDAQEEVRSEIVQVALLASKEVIGREINEKDNTRLVQDFIKEISN